MRAGDSETAASLLGWQWEDASKARMLLQDDYSHSPFSCCSTTDSRPGQTLPHSTAHISLRAPREHRASPGAMTHRGAVLAPSNSRQW